MTRYRAKPFVDGFTMIEMIVVIVITGIIAGAVAVFIRVPVQGYVDAARRAEMTDIADSALRRMERDLRLALPNSIRITDGGATVEFLLTRTGGRYRATDNGAIAGDYLDFTQPDSSFDQFGPRAPGTGQTIVANSDRLVVYNLGISGANAYASDNTSLITSAVAAGDLTDEYKITFLPKQFLFESPGARFQVIEGPVTYACDTTTGKLTRYWGYSIFPAQQPAATIAALPTASHALVATNVESCVFDYTPGVTARSAVMALTLKITESSGAGQLESAQLYHEVHVSNVP